MKIYIVKKNLMWSHHPSIYKENDLNPFPEIPRNDINDEWQHKKRNHSSRSVVWD